jgi:CHAD domain-containing protein
VPQSPSIWRLRARALDEARRSLERGDTEGLHDLRIALRRVAVTARALKHRRVYRKARRIARALSRPRQLEVDRRLLCRIGELGFLSPDALTALAARWDESSDREARKVARAAGGRALRSLRRKVAHLPGGRAADALGPIETARRKAEAALAGSLEGATEKTLHRCRRAVEKARYLAEDLAALGLSEWAAAGDRERLLHETLGRWNDLTLFAGRLRRARAEAEERGAVTLSGEIGRLLAALEPAIASLLREAAALASRGTARVVPLRRKAG